jgi:hypothetical protein
MHLGEPVSFDTWGEHAYVLDLVAEGAMQHQGAAPTSAREAFLAGLVAAFAEGGTRSMVLHSQERHHDAAQRRIAAAFLDVALEDFDRLKHVARSGRTRSEQIEAWSHDDRLVIRCRHLSNAVVDSFLKDLARLIW